MSPHLLNVLDNFREDWGDRVFISTHPQALGRRLGPNSHSQHNVDLWGQVRAADLFPDGMNTPDDFARAYECAKSAGASGVGIYTDTTSPMIHLDVRQSTTPDNPAKWSRVRGEYLGIEEVMPEGWKP